MVIILDLRHVYKYDNHFEYAKDWDVKLVDIYFIVTF